MSRHGRQTRLAEVGLAGQARIHAARIDIPMGGLAGNVAARYLAGAGVGCLRVRSPAVAAAATAIEPGVRIEIEDAGDERPHNAPSPMSDEAPFDLRDPVARDVARGARFALRALRAVLETAS
jgi:hypothetical protein